MLGRTASWMEVDIVGLRFGVGKWILVAWMRR
jgi:hypothetical protein